MTWSSFKYQVSKLFRDIIDNTSILQYRIELGVSLVVPTPRAKTLSIEEKIQYLRDRQPSGSNPHLHNVQDIQIPDPPPGRQCGDVFCTPYRTHVQDDEGRYNALRCVSISRVNEQLVRTTWELTFAEEFHGFIADPSRDLLVLSTQNTLENQCR